jgi:hypothetical protein
VPRPFEAGGVFDENGSETAGTGSLNAIGWPAETVMKKVTVRVMGIILYAAQFSDVQRAFLSEGTGNIPE